MLATTFIGRSRPCRIPSDSYGVVGGSPGTGLFSEAVIGFRKAYGCSLEQS